MDNNVINLKRIPFIPKLSRNFKPVKHYLCETDTSAKLISRTAFMRQLARQALPQGTGLHRLRRWPCLSVPLRARQRAERFIAAYGEFETEYKRFYREQQAIREGRRLTVAHLDQFDDSCADGDEMQSTWLVSETTPEDEYLARGTLHHSHIVLQRPVRF